MQQRALEIAIGHLSIIELPGNRGVEIDQWNIFAGNPLGSSYCMAHVIYCYNQAAQELNMRSPLPKTGHCGRFWMRCPLRWRTGKPIDGAIYIHLAEPDAPEESKGHCGIVATSMGALMNGVEANTSAFHAKLDSADDRNGDGVHLKQRAIDYAHGFIDISVEDLEDTNPMRILPRE
jgi:hypothetical protein